MTGWIILWVVIGLILLVLLTPIRACFAYSDSFEVKLRIWFVSIPLIPTSSEQPKKQKQPKAQQSKKRLPKTQKDQSQAQPSFLQQIKQEQGLGGLIDFFKQLTLLAGRSLTGLFRHLILQTLDLRLEVGTGDAAETAKQYGIACSTVYPAVNGLLQVMKHHACRVEVTPDFLSEQTHIQCRITLRLRVFWVLRMAVGAAIAFIRLIVREKRKGRPVSGTIERKRSECQKNPQKV